MKKILVLVEDYPNNNGGVTLMYVHTRHLYYVNNNIDVVVLNFRAKMDYEIDGIKVICLETYKKQLFKSDIVILHAANIRNHLRFLLQYGDKFKRFIFFFHGHEVLRNNKVYSKPYPYLGRSLIKECFQEIYDMFKLLVWRFYLPRIRDKSYYIFVSKWMKDEFFKWTKISRELLNERCYITYNTVGHKFQDLFFDSESSKEFDFCTIRNNLDGSKYSIDIVNDLATNTPDKRFVVVGKGEFFKYFKKAPNLIWINKTLNHEEIIQLLQKSRFALMPTRTDAQGLMMCEMAALGIPLITSNISVCREVFGDFSNVYFIDNFSYSSLEKFTDDMSVCEKHTKYYEKNTVKHEVELLEKVLNEVYCDE